MPKSIDLIHLGAPHDSKVVVRVRGTEPEDECVLVGEIIVDTGFVRGRRKTWIFPEDLTEWETVLDTLDSGRSCFWRRDKQAIEMHIAFDDRWDERLWVTLADRMGSLTNLRMAVEPPETWLADHRNRLQRVRKTWPIEQA